MAHGRQRSSHSLGAQRYGEVRAFGRDLSSEDGTLIGARAHLGHGGNLPIIMPAYLPFGFLIA